MSSDGKFEYRIVHNAPSPVRFAPGSNHTVDASDEPHHSASSHLNLSADFYHLIIGSVFLLLPDNPKRVEANTSRMLLFRVTPDLTTLQWSEPLTGNVVGYIPLSSVSKVRHAIFTQLPSILEPWLVFSIFYKGRPDGVLHLHASHYVDVANWIIGLQACWLQISHRGVVMERHRSALATKGFIRWQIFIVKYRLKAKRKGVSLFRYLSIQARDPEIRRQMSWPSSTSS